MPVSALVLRACYVRLRDEGLAGDEVLRCLLRALQDSDALHPEVDPRLVVRALSRLDPGGTTRGLALKLGMAAPARTLGPLGDLLAHCATPRAAVDAARRFLFLMQAGGDLRAVDSAGQTLICYEPPPATGRARRFASEFAVSLIVAVARELLGAHVPPKEVLFAFAEPPHVETYQSLLGCPVRFGADVTAVAFEAGSLDGAQLFADPELRRRIEARLERMVRVDAREASFRLRVRGILEREGERILADRSPHLIAQRMGISQRFLRRRLEAEGTSLFRVIEQFSKEKAIWMMVEQGEPLKVVADRLGFSQVSAFHRAFRRWTGVTPSQYRLQARRDEPTGTREVGARVDGPSAPRALRRRRAARRCTSSPCADRAP